MDMLTQLNRAMAYVEAHIDDSMALADVSGETAYSPYHFGRLFYYIAGMPLSEYIRRRKLSLAAMAMQNGGARVLDVAVMYGYDSADSFTRAFVRQHGITPSAARRPGVSLTIFPPLTFQITIKGVQAMNWRIEEREAFEVFGIERVFSHDEMDKLPGFWHEFHETGACDKLCAAAGVRSGDHGERGINAVCGYREVEGNCFPYMIYTLRRPESNVEGYTVAHIPKATWAVFRSEAVPRFGPAIPVLFDRAYKEWLPASEYERAAAPDLEIYCMEADGGLYEEVWIPVVKR